MERVRQGSCLCGAVTYRVSGPLRPVVACHCVQCRKTSGNFVTATQALASDTEIFGDVLVWFRSSETAERGFCGRCGSNLFWRLIGDSKISIFAGTIDGDTGLALAGQLYPESKGDYYNLPDVPVIKQGAPLT